MKEQIGRILWTQAQVRQPSLDQVIDPNIMALSLHNGIHFRVASLGRLCPMGDRETIRLAYAINYEPPPYGPGKG